MTQGYLVSNIADLIQSVERYNRLLFCYNELYNKYQTKEE